MAGVMKGRRKTAKKAKDPTMDLVDLVAYPILTEEVAYPPSPLATEAANVSAVQHVQCLFVDEENKPFVRRPVWVLLPNGDEIEVLTDQQGSFEAPRGSRVYAREDEWGLATEPILLTE